MKYTTVIGLEIHAELLTKSKIFCKCSNEFGGRPNQRVCPVCLGMPGTLPVLNREAVTLAARAGLALGCRVNPYSAFDRKNYFYPDLPKAYQITQFFQPICEDGRMMDIGIQRIHLEEDAGKLIHGEQDTLVDYNRCGVPLIEIVTEPDFKTAESVCRFVEEVCLRLRYTDVCDARLEQGSLRVDVNISRMPADAPALGNRAEIKNLNSLRSIRRAIAFEEKRQGELLDAGQPVPQETRRFDEQKGVTQAMRAKAEARDYRYFPEPDIPPVMISKAEIEAIRRAMPEMPEDRRRRYQADGLPAEQIRLLTADRPFSDFYDQAAAAYPACKTALAGWMTGELNRNLHELGKPISQIPLSPVAFADLIRLCQEGKITNNAGKDILKTLCRAGGDPAEIARSRGILDNQDPAKIRELAEAVVAENPKAAAEYQAGNPKIIGFLMGQIMRRGGVGLDPGLCRQCILELLKNH